MRAVGSICCGSAEGNPRWIADLRFACTDSSGAAVAAISGCRAVCDGCCCCVSDCFCAAAGVDCKCTCASGSCRAIGDGCVLGGA